MTTLSTGGFSQHQQSMGHFAGTGKNTILFAVMLFMLLGAVSMPLYYYMIYEGGNRLFRDLQARYLLALALTGRLLFWSAASWLPAKFPESVFHAISSLTTTGFSISDPSTWDEKKKSLSIILMVFGGGACSTAGGIKLLRLIIVVKLATWAVLKSMLPAESKLPIRYGEMAISADEIRHVGSFLALYAGLLCISSLVLIYSGFPMVDALFESCSALGTVGLSTGIVSPDLSTGLKLMMAFDMWAGRLEILPVLVTLYPGKWTLHRR
jgi:trk system potassium uptake protein TrkH